MVDQRYGFWKDRSWLTLLWEGGQWSPIELYVQIPRTCEYVTFCGKGDFAAVLTLNIVK